MNRKKVFYEALIYTVSGLFFGTVFFRQTIFSRFDLLLGDVGDARFNGVILEHWWQVFQGIAPWLSPPFFFPVQGVLGYSDAGFLNALAYACLRFTGIDSFTSYQIVLFALVMVGWIGTILFFRYCLKLGKFATVVGAIIFIFPNSMAVSIQHTQLWAICFIPYLAIGLYLSFQKNKKKKPIGISAGIFVAIAIPAIFYTGYYIGWFSIFYLFLLLGVACGWCAMHLGARVVWLRFLWNREVWRKVWRYFTLSAICFIPFLLTYVPVLRQFGRRGYREIVTMLPSFIDYVNVGPDNWLWGNLLYSGIAGIGSRPMLHELIKGMPIFSLLVFLAFAVHFILKTRHYQPGMMQNGAYKILVGQNEITDDEKLSILAAALSVAVLFAWLLMLRIEKASLWVLVLGLVPGSGGIRAVSRFQHVLAFPIAMVVAIGLHQSVHFVTNHIRPPGKRCAALMVIVFFGLLLIGEQFNTSSQAKYSKQQQLEMLASIYPPPKQVKVFAVLPSEGLKKLPYEAQIDAMIIAQKYGLKTINGYSGQFPPGFGRVYDFDKAEYAASLKRWIECNHLYDDGLYFLDLKTGTWLAAATLDPSLHERAEINATCN
jgi:hypothetical protein